MAAKKNTAASIDIAMLATKTLEVCIVGTTPLICNAMSAKVQQELLLPPKKKRGTAREATLKHEPMEEYRRSPYRSRGDEAPTRIVFPGGGVKAAIARAALDIPGANKTQIGRLSYVNERDIAIYGVPEILMSVVRNSDMARTPDVRTRAIIPEWAARLSVTFVTPNLNETAIANLLASAGIIVGLGDWRPEKGKGNYGQFRLATLHDAEFKRIVKAGGREAQDAALENPTAHNQETADLLEWFDAEARRRGFEVA